MGLAQFLFKTEEQRRLAALVWDEGLEASVREFSLMSGLSYATAYEELHTMEDLGLVKKVTQGRSTLYSSALSKEEKSLFKKLLSSEDQTTSQKLKFAEALFELGLPYAGSTKELGNEPVADKEELVVRATFRAKENATLARALPVLLAKLLPQLNEHRLMYWAKKYEVKKEFGFFVDLTGFLSEKKTYRKMAKAFFDQRWSQNDFLFSPDNNAKGFQAELVEMNTPQLAKHWHLKMNMGLDSFESLFKKFAKDLA